MVMQWKKETLSVSSASNPRSSKACHMKENFHDVTILLKGNYYLINLQKMDSFFWNILEIQREIAAVDALMVIWQ